MKKVVKNLPLLLGVIFVFVIALGANTYTSGASRDTDKDGLTDRKEITLGTNPNDPDTDNDGLSDGLEVKDTNTNPKDADSDNDGLKDGEELAQGTDPNNPDSDGDGIVDSQDVDNDPIEADKFEASLVPTTNTLTFEEGRVEIKSESGGVKVEMEIKGVSDTSTGELVTNTGNKFLIDAAVDGVPSVLEIPFDLNGGEAEVEENLDLSGQFLSIHTVLLEDPNNETFASPGIILQE